MRCEVLEVRNNVTYKNELMRTLTWLEVTRARSEWASYRVNRRAAPAGSSAQRLIRRLVDATSLPLLGDYQSKLAFRLL